MNLFNGVIPITGISFLMLCIFGILFVGYALGRITIKGVSLGDAGVFIIALLFGALFYDSLISELAIKDSVSNEVVANYASQALKIIENLGLVLFVTSVGFIAGPKFFGNMKKNFKSYVLIGLVIILAGGLSAVLCIYTGDIIGYGSGTDTREGFVAMIVGLLSGSLTSTPAFSAAKDTVAADLEGLVSVGHGIAYIFGVIGVVLFVQLVPKVCKANMDEERAKITFSSDNTPQKKEGTFKLDDHGIGVFALAAILGTFVGKITGAGFSLTTTGGCLLVSLVLGHFGKIGKFSLMPDQHTLKLFRELGLVLFLVGAGVAGGAEFVESFDPMYFVYGVVMTVIPMFVGFFFAKYVLKLSLLNNLGSITGGMTSTPALGTLINVAKTEDVAAAYAATYPIALIAVVLVSQLIILLF